MCYLLLFLFLFLKRKQNLPKRTKFICIWMSNRNHTKWNVIVACVRERFQTNVKTFASGLNYACVCVCLCPSVLRVTFSQRLYWYFGRFDQIHMLACIIIVFVGIFSVVFFFVNNNNRVTYRVDRSISHRFLFNLNTGWLASCLTWLTVCSFVFFFRIIVLLFLFFFILSLLLLSLLLFIWYFINSSIFLLFYFYCSMFCCCCFRFFVCVFISTMGHCCYLCPAGKLV